MARLASPACVVALFMAVNVGPGLGAASAAPGGARRPQARPEVLMGATRPYTDTWAAMAAREARWQRDIAAGRRAPRKPINEPPYHRSLPRPADSNDATPFPAPPFVGDGRARAGSGDAGPRAPQGQTNRHLCTTKFGQMSAGFGSWIPPDTMGAAGPDHFLEVINGSVGVYSNSTHDRLSFVSLESFFYLRIGSTYYPRNGCFDPRVLYDRASGRWFAISLEFGVVSGTDNDLMLAVSRTADPTGTWDKYHISIGHADSLTDYDTLGVDNKGVYMAVRIFGPDESHVHVLATTKSNLVAASPFLSSVYSFGAITDMGGTPMPAHNHDTPPAGGRAWFVASSADVSANVLYRTLTWDADYVPALSATGMLTTPGYGGNPDAPARGSAKDVDTGTTRLLMSVIKNRRLWTCRNVGVNSTGAGVDPDRCAAEWLELNVSAEAPTLVQSGRAYDPAAANPRHYYFPSIMVNGQGHAAMAFSGSASDEYIGAYTCGRLATDPLGTMQLIDLIFIGSAAYDVRDTHDRNRWGDYSYTTLDPDDDMTIWTIQETSAAIADGWQTHRVQLKSPAPTASNPGAHIQPGRYNVSLAITGTNFYDPGPGYADRIRAEFEGGAVNGISDIVTTFNSETSLTVRYDIAVAASLGTRALRIINPDGESVLLADALTVDAVDTAMTMGDRSGAVEASVALSATLKRVDNLVGIYDKPVEFRVAGVVVGYADTAASGVAAFAYDIPEGLGLGGHSTKATFAKQTPYEGCSDTGTLTVVKSDTALVLSDTVGRYGQKAPIPAELARLSDGERLVGRSVEFRLDGPVLGSATTNGSGVAVFAYDVPDSLALGAHSLVAQYAGETLYNGSADTAAFTVVKAGVLITVNDATGPLTGSVKLAAILRRATDDQLKSGCTLSYSVEGTTIGSAVTNGSGTASLAYAIPFGLGTGAKSVACTFAGDATCEAGTGEGTLTVTKVGTKCSTLSRTAAITDAVQLKAYLYRQTDSAAVEGRTVGFRIDGTSVGSGVTSAAGMASYTWVISSGPASRTILAEFAGDKEHNTSSGSATLTALTWSTKMASFDRTARITARTELKARLVRSDNLPLYNRTIRFSVDGTFVIDRPTDTQGYARYPNYDVPDGAGAGSRTILSEWAGNAGYLGVSKTAVLTVLKALPYIWVMPRKAPVGGTANLYAYFRRLLDYQKQTGKTVTFRVDGTAVQTLSTDGSGVARYLYPTVEVVGDHVLRCEFGGDAWVEAGYGEAALTLY